MYTHTHVHTHTQLQRAFPEEDTLLDAALAALASLAAGNRAHQDRIGELGACELVARTVGDRAESAHFLTRCSSVVLALSELEKADADGHPLHIWKYVT